MDLESFSLDIDMGNELMCEPAHVADALRRAAHELDVMGAQEGRIRDENGNLVGGYGFNWLRDRRLGERGGSDMTNTETTHMRTAPASAAQRGAIARVSLDHPGARVHARSGDNGPLWLTWPDREPLRIHPDGAAWPVAAAPTPCYMCAELCKPLRLRVAGIASLATIAEERAARAAQCPVCGGSGVLGDTPAESEIPPAHDSDTSQAAEDWLAIYPGLVADRVPIAVRGGHDGRERVRAAYAARRRANPEEPRSASLDAVAQAVGMSKRQVRTRLKHGAPHGESLARTLADLGL